MEPLERVREWLGQERLPFLEEETTGDVAWAIATEPTPGRIGLMVLWINPADKLRIQSEWQIVDADLATWQALTEPQRLAFVIDLQAELFSHEIGFNTRGGPDRFGVLIFEDIYPEALDRQRFWTAWRRVFCWSTMVGRRLQGVLRTPTAPMAPGGSDTRVH